MTKLPKDAKERKNIPLYSGCIDYFPLALAAVARLSQKGGDQHHPGELLHWDRSKSGDELDAMMRHVVDGDWEAVAWRALAHLQKEIEEGYVPNEPKKGVVNKGYVEAEKESSYDKPVFLDFPGLNYDNWMDVVGRKYLKRARGDDRFKDSWPGTYSLYREYVDKYVYADPSDYIGDTDRWNRIQDENLKISDDWKNEI